MYKSFWNVRWNTCPRPGSWICDENEWQTVSTGRIFVTEVQRPVQWAPYPSCLPPIQRLSVLECGGRESAGAPRCPTTLSGGRRHRRLHFEECLVGRLAGMCLQEAPGWNFEGVGTTTCSLIRLLGKPPYKRTIFPATTSLLLRLMGGLYVWECFLSCLETLVWEDWRIHLLALMVSRALQIVPSCHPGWENME